jgi:hypothetical protein
MNVAPNRRKLPPLRRVVAYIPEEEAEWLESAARAQGWTVSRYIAWLLSDAHHAERLLVVEMEQERMAIESGT